MKKVISLALALIMVLAMAIPAFAADAAEVPASKFTGNYELQDEYLAYYTNLFNTGATQFDVYTADAFFVLISLANGKNETFKGKTISLKADLVFNEGYAMNWGEKAPDHEFVGFNNFQGTFDGEGHSISGVYIKKSDIYHGIFKIVKSGAIIKNFRVLNSYFSSDHASYTPSVIGRINNDPRWGDGSANITISNIYSDAYIVGKNACGGIVGLITNVDQTLLIEKCVFAGSITANSQAGGIVGKGGTYRHSDAGEHWIILSDCVNLGNITSKTTMAGAMSGEASKIKLTNCANFGTVTSADGYNSNAMISRMYGHAGEYTLDTDGDKKGKTYDKVPDLVCEITNCYNVTANVFGNGTPPEAAAESIKTQVTNFTNTKTVNVITLAGVSGDAAKTALAGFDFTTVWATRANAVPLPKVTADMLAGVVNAKDPNIDVDSYIGTEIEEPEEEEEEEEEEDVKTNSKKEEETTADTAAPETEAPAEEKSGCGSTIGIASLAVLAIAGGATIVATKKKED